ncbi:MAG: PIN domain-containing protein, partial [Actinobacteria bacterium]
MRLPHSWIMRPWRDARGRATGSPIALKRCRPGCPRIGSRCRERASMIARCFVDANVLVYAHGPGGRGETARALVRDLSAADALVVSSQVVAETFVNLARLSDADTADAQINDLLEASECLAVGIDTVQLALRLRRRFGLSYWDAQIVASAALGETRILLTEDLQSGQVI